MALFYSRPLALLIEELQKLPGIGPKSAQRMAFWLLKQPTPAVERFARVLIEAKDQIRFCSVCSNLSAQEPCELCTQPGREGHTICVVAEPKDLVALERTREYKGLYHVLQGLISPLEGVGPEQLKIKELLARVGTGGVQELIFAINPTIEGEATTLYLSQLFRPLNIRLTRIAFGLPIGGDMELADELTLVRALEGRREI